MSYVVTFVIGDESYQCVKCDESVRDIEPRMRELKARYWEALDLSTPWRSGTLICSDEVIKILDTQRPKEIKDIWSFQ